MSPQEDRVELLRRAADRLRRERTGVAPVLADKIADWLDGEASTLASMESWVEVLNASITRKEGAPALLTLSKDENGDPAVHSDTSYQAAAVALVVLGQVSPASAVSVPLPVVHNPWDSSCTRHVAGEASRPEDQCFACHPSWIFHAPDPGV